MGDLYFFNINEVFYPHKDNSSLQTIEAIEQKTIPELIERSTEQINGLVYLVQGDLKPGNRITVEALIVLDVHGNVNLVSCMIRCTVVCSYISFNLECSLTGKVICTTTCTRELFFEKYPRLQVIS